MKSMKLGERGGGDDLGREESLGGSGKREAIGQNILYENSYF